ncbi:myophilin-like [Oscarella lobularis]|uniref:myophilin-like n=1 Tax=Oscarella lobularis TaxID=121494 RepID=UPI00331408F4
MSESECRGWIEAVTGEKLSGALQEALKDGKTLCKLINVLEPGSVKKIQESKMAFKQMENISAFTQAVRRYGVPDSENFQTVDLFEGQNMKQVLICIDSLGRQAQKKGFSGPKLGVKMSEKNERNFSQDQIDAGKFVASKQMGSNQGATQAGLGGFGNQRKM